MFEIKGTPFWRSVFFIRVLAVLLVAVLVIGLVRPANAAIAYRSASSGNNGGGSSGLSITTPSGAAAGDILIASIDMRVGTTGSFTISAPAGWQAVGNSMGTSSTLNHAFYLVLSSAPRASYTFDLFDGGVPYVTKASGGMIAYSGVDTQNPINATSVGSYASSATMNTPSITTTVPNAMIIALYGAATGTTATQGSSMTERFDDASTGQGAASRTTSAGQDAVQASAGATGQKTMTLASGAVHTARTVALTPAPVISQAGYRFMTNQDGTSVGVPLGAQNASLSTVAPGQVIRLRMLLGVSELGLTANNTFKLQYRLTTNGTCDGTGAYVDMTTITPVQYYNNPSPSDGVTLTSNGSDPIRSGVTVVNQTYEESNDFTNTSSIPAGQDGLWDFAIALSSTASRQYGYCIRAVYASGVPLATYTQIPQVSLSHLGGMIASQDYRLYQSADNVSPGSPLVADNTPTTLAASNEQFRLRGTVNGSRGFSQIDSGGSHTCAIASDNQAYCWGDDTYGQLGNGAISGDQASPTAVDTSGVLSGKTILSISAGDFHTCAIASDNLVYCWGLNTTGQIGQGSMTGDQASPVAVTTSGALSGKTILSVSAGGNQTCVIASDNQAYCWGGDADGQLGNGDILTANQASPVAVTTSGALSGKTILSVSAGDVHTCVIASDNQAYCWGDDTYGRLGNGATTGDQTSPVAVDTSGVLSGKTSLSIAAGTYHTCVVASDNQAYCWGYDLFEQLGNGAATGEQVSPVAVVTSGVLSGKTISSIISAGTYNTCAIASDNQAYCWGGDNSGENGNGSAGGGNSPVAVDTSGVLAGRTILSIAAGGGHTCAIASDNQAHCWGSDADGELGNGSTTGNQVSPSTVSINGALFGKTIVSVSASRYFTCAIASDNQAYCWGSDSSGQLGNGAITGDQVIPVAVDTSGVLAGKTILSISAGPNHACVIASDNQAYCWGSDSSGQLGNGATTGDQASPVAVDTSGVLSGKTILSISAGGSNTCVIASDSQAYCWGADGSGQVGNGATTGTQASPVAVDTSGALSGKTVLSIKNYTNHACVIASDNQAYCWGSDSDGQVGNGATTGNQASPVAVDTSGVLAGKNVLSISLGNSSSCALASDNQAYCWGTDFFGQQGNGAVAGDQVSPGAVDTTGALSGKTILSLSAGYSHACAIASDNQAYCWGEDVYGQIGNGTATSTDQVSPAAVDITGVLYGKTILNISLGLAHSCAIASDNQAYCWGEDAVGGSLGNGIPSANQASPVAVTKYVFERFTLVASRLSLVLQYAQKSAGSCSAQTGFASISTVTPISLHDNASVTSGTAVIAGITDPGGGFNVAQTYHDVVDTISNSSSINGENRGLWDISLRDNGAPASTTYCLRFATSENGTFSSYTYLPEITTASSGGAPVDTNAGLLRGGQAVVDGIKQLFSW